MGNVIGGKYLLLGTAHKHHHPPGDLYERIFLGLELLWIVVVAIAIVRRTPATQRARSGAGPS